MDYKEIALKLENNDKDIQKEIINTLNEEDYITIKELFLYLKNNSKKAVVNNYLNIIITNTKDVYDDEMHLNSNLSYLREEQPLIIKYMLINNYRFTDNQIQNMSNNMIIQLPIESVLSIICKRIEKKHFSVSLLNLAKIKKILTFAYDNELDGVVEVMVDDYDFIIQYNNSNIDTPLLLKHSQNLKFREKIMTSTRFIQEIKSVPEHIAPYLSQEEIKYLKTDIRIKNIFLSKGLRYDVLEESVVNNLLDNITIFKMYPFSTINEFIDSVREPINLIDDKKFFDIYLEKITSISPKINLFQLLNKTQIDRIIALYPREIIYLNIFINAKEDYKEWLLEKEEIKTTLYSTKKYEVYNYIDSKLLLDILKNKDYIFEYHKYFNLLNEKELQVLINNKESYNQFINEIKNNNLDIPSINRILTILNLSYQKEFVKNITDFFPSYLYLDFLSSNIPLYLEIIRSNKHLYTIINSFIPTEIEKIRYLLQNLNKDDLLIVKKITISNPALAKIIKECSSSSESTITDIYLSTPVDELIYIIKRNDSVVIDLIQEKVSNATKINIIMSCDKILSIFLNNKFIKFYDRPFLLAILDKLNKKQKEKYLNTKLLNYLYSSETIKVYNNLKEKNQNILSTLNISFLNANTIKLKFSILEYLTKYKELQNNTLLLLDYITAKDITSLFLALEEYDKEYLLPKLFKIISDSLKGKNRKKIGNFVNFFREIKTITKEDWLNIISYLLYHITLVPDTIKNNIVPVPSNYNELKNYELDFFRLAPEPLLKHYRLTREEVYYITNKYSKGYLFINNLNHLNLTNKEKIVKRSYKILEVFKEITKIREDYNNKLSYELKKTINNLPKINNILIKESYTFYTSKDKYTYLVFDKDELSFEKYTNYIESVTTSFRTIILKDDNLSPKNGLYYTYSNLNKNSLKDFTEDSYYLNKYSPSKNGITLTLPDNILVVQDNANDLSLIAEAIKVYKSFKPYKELKIILLNKEDVFNRLIEKYKKNITLSNLSKCVKMLSENDYKYSITNLTPIIYKHLKSKEKEQVSRIILEHKMIEDDLEKYSQKH